MAAERGFLPWSLPSPNPNPKTTPKPELNKNDNPKSHCTQQGVYFITAEFSTENPADRPTGQDFFANLEPNHRNKNIPQDVVAHFNNQ